VSGHNHGAELMNGERGVVSWSKEGSRTHKGEKVLRGVIAPPFQIGRIRSLKRRNVPARLKVPYSVEGGFHKAGWKRSAANDLTL